MNTARLKKPVFVVGHPRSGTTLLATVLGRNSELAMPPETQFFIENCDFGDGVLSESNARLILNRSRLRDLHLDEEEVMGCFLNSDRKLVSLFEIIIDRFRAKFGKARAGEKSPFHLFYSRTLLAHFPHSRIVCIERNGSDVVASLMRMPWSHRKFSRHVFDWCKSIEYANTLEAEFPDRFRRVSFEKLTRDPKSQLSEICAFCDLEYQDQMLTPSESETIPEWERDWKGAAFMNIRPKETVGEEALSFTQRAIFRTFANREMDAGVDRRDLATVREMIMAWVLAWPYHPKIHPYLQRARARFGL
ncbi:sulfotransferase family protein [Qipengyuania flava]|jgi:hypothetical protein|uniref:sulfotransferase family protein n=1 Tax=Qipengyuania flava TaxID=192812 RepID=UPI00321A5A04